MKTLNGLLTVLVFTLSVASAHAGGYSASAARKYIADSEAGWVAAEVAGDPSAARRILADDYVGVFPDGTVHNKADAVGFFKPGDTSLSAHLDYVHIRFFGDTAIAQGQETDMRRAGDPVPSGRLIFTDVFVLRNGRWQIVNSEDQFQPLPK